MTCAHQVPRCATVLQHSSRQSKHRMKRRRPESHLIRDGNCRIYEDESIVRLAMDLPGIRGDQLSVHHAAGILTVEGTRFMNVGGTLRKYKFAKSFAMEEEFIDVSRMKADMTAAQPTLVIFAPKIVHATPLIVQFSQMPLETIHESWEEDCECSY